jgi:hypothetical protein
MATFYLGQARSAASAPRIRALASASIEWASSLLKASLGARDLGSRGLNPQLLADIGEIAPDARQDALEAPLGEIAGQFELGGIPLFAHRRGPLG